MSRPEQDPRYRSGSYQTPLSDPHQQPEQFNPSVAMNQDHYQNQHTHHPTYPEGLRPHQPSRPSGSYPPYAGGHMSFPEPHQHSPTGPPATYFTPPQSMPHSSIGTHQLAHQDTSGGSFGARSETSGYPSESSSAYSFGPGQGTSGYAPTSGSSSGGHRAYSVGSSVTSSTDSDSYSVSRQVAYTGANAQPQGWNPTGHDEGQGEEYDGFRPKGPSSFPVVGYPRRCRYPGCNRLAFFDRRVNQYWEWCEDHMWVAVANRVESACRQCQVWPRRSGYTLCGGNVCWYTPGP